MTTDDNRPRAAGGYADSGLYDGDTDDFADQDYGSDHRRGRSRTSSGASMFDDAGYSGATTTMLDDDEPVSATPAYDDLDRDYDLEETPRRPAWHGGLDFGLLVLRVVVGAFFVAHGLDKLFGWFTGLGMGGTEQLLTGFGYTEPKILAWVTAVAETGGGALLLLGLFTPAAAAAVLGVMANAIAVTADWNLFLGDSELELTYAAAVFALLFTGPGRISLDRNTHWFRKAPAYGFLFLVLAAGATVATLIVLR